MKPSGTVLGFDFGTHFIGIAIGQTLIKTARPLSTLKRKNKLSDWAQIEALFEQWQPEAAVVGLPLTLDGKTQEMTRLAAKFANQLRGRFNLPVHEIDERLSTRVAQMDLAHDIMNGQKHKGSRKEQLDQIAAQIILQAWFDEHE